ncbi:hypothetical protein CRYUN_Cryun18bG0058500 [Craigia yunnanensis]
MILMENHPWIMAHWHCFSQCVKEGGIVFNKGHKCKIWDFASRNSEFNRLFNNGMACISKVVTKAILLGYKKGFYGIESFVEVEGGIGGLISKISMNIRTSKVLTSICHMSSRQHRHTIGSVSSILKRIWVSKSFHVLTNHQGPIKVWVPCHNGFILGD